VASPVMSRRTVQQWPAAARRVWTRAAGRWRRGTHPQPAPIRGVLLNEAHGRGQQEAGGPGVLQQLRDRRDGPLRGTPNRSHPAC
jgi:hypothetical protein